MGTMLRAAVALAALASASAFAPIASPAGLQLRAKNVARAPRSTGIVMQQANPMSSAVAEFAEKAPELASRGLGVTTNAERWNGRHAMFGMFLMTFTAYLKGHGLIPDADKVLDVNQWGPLAYAGMARSSPTSVPSSSSLTSTSSSSLSSAPSLPSRSRTPLSRRRDAPRRPPRA